MKKLLSIILSAIMLLSLTSCTKADAAWQEKYDAGLRYLEDLEYESAIQSFNEAIEIDPKQPRAYVALAGVQYSYAGGGSAAALDTINKAIEATGGSDTLQIVKEQIETTTFDYRPILDRATAESAAVKTKTEPGDYGGTKNISYDAKGNQVVVSYTDKDGKPARFHAYEYNRDNLCTKETIYYGSQFLQSILYEYDSKGRVIKGTKCNADGPTGSMVVTEYDADGLRSDMNYDKNGVLWKISEYDAEGRIIKDAYYENNTLRNYYLHEYSADGLSRTTTHCGDDYSVLHETAELNLNGTIRESIMYDQDGAISLVTNERGSFDALEYIIDCQNPVRSETEPGPYGGELKIYYDANDNAVAEMIIFSKALGIEPELSVYTYNRDNNCTKKEVYDGDADLYRYVTYEYDSHGRLEKENTYEADGTLVFIAISEYDANGLRIETVYDSDGEIEDVREYDDEGRIIREESYYHGLCKYCLVFEYSEDGLTETIWWDELDGRPYIFAKAKLYPNGQYKESITYNSDGSILAISNENGSQWFD